MAEQEFEGDLAGSVFWGADLQGARFRDVDLTGARIEHAWVLDVEIDALVDRLVVNGVDVTAYVHERDPWQPLRRHTRVRTVEEIRAGWPAFEAAWTSTIAAARALPEARLHESVAGEFSFVQTLRHLVFAIDKWCTAPILGGGFEPMGLPNTGSLDFPWPGLDPDARPSVEEAVAAWSDRAATLRRVVEGLDPAEVDRTVEVLENGTHALHECIGTVYEEAFWHLRYAERDLALLA